MMRPPPACFSASAFRVVMVLVIGVVSSAGFARDGNSPRVRGVWRTAVFRPMVRGVSVASRRCALGCSDVASALQTFGALYDAGADPIQLLTDLADAVHAVSRIKVAGSDAASAALSETEKQRAITLAKALSVPVLARVWQMLLKALDETARSPRVLAAAEMAIIRLCYVSDLPPPNEVLKGFFATPSDGANSEQTVSYTHLTLPTNREV